MKNDIRGETVAWNRTACHDDDWGLRSRIPQLFRLLRGMQLLHATTTAVYALRKLRVPFVRGVERSLISS